MSGSSLDGLDIAYVQLEEVRGKWSFEILHTDCISYTAEWTTNLRNAADMSVPAFLKLHTAYGKLIGNAVNAFINRHDLGHKVHFIASHGHTVFHEPAQQTTFQIGDGASIAALTGLPVISDLRMMDVALGGQGAPIVPIGDRLLFGNYDYLLNLGGIANITVQAGDNNSIAFDVCPANQILNALALREGKPMDENGAMAAKGSLLFDVKDQLANNAYYHTTAPKSLSNEAAQNIAEAVLHDSTNTTQDLLHTFCNHIADQVAAAVHQCPVSSESKTMLITGGGALNTHLIAEIKKRLEPAQVTIDVPSIPVVQYKEALVMALIGALRWREEINVLGSVTGASRDSAGGALWLP